MFRRPLRPLRSVSSLGLFAFAAAAPYSAAAQIDLETIMQAPEWIGRAPDSAYWSADSRSILFSRATPIVEEESGNRFDPRSEDLYRIAVPEAFDEAQWPLGESELSPLAPSEKVLIESRSRVDRSDRKAMLWVRAGDLFLRSLEGDGPRVSRLTRTSAVESQPFFLVDGRIGYQRDGAVLARDLETGIEEELFVVRGGLSPALERQEDLSDLDPLERAERRLIDWVVDGESRETRRHQQARRDAAEGATARPPFHLGKKRAAQRTVASPNGRWAIAVSVPEGPPPEGDRMPQFVTATGRVEVRPVRPKVGTPRSGPAQLHLLDRASGLQYAIDLSGLEMISDDPLAQLRAEAKARKESPESSGALESASQPTNGSPSDDETRESEPESEPESESESESDGKPAEPRGVDVGTVLWSEDGSRVVFQLFSRDNKDRWIASVPLEGLKETSPASRGEAPWGEASEEPLEAFTLLHDRDPAWINWRYRGIQFLPSSNRELLVLSERTGWSQLYRLTIEADAAIGHLSRLTNGDFVVDSVQVDPAGQWAYFTSNKGDTGIYDVYRLALQAPRGSDIQQVTSLGGRNSYSLSPDGQRLAVLHGRSTHPPELYLQDATPGATAHRLTRTVSEEFSSLEWVTPEFVEVPSSNVDRPIKARLFLPPKDTGQAESRPAVVFVHGAGYLQNAHRGWSSYFYETMFHSLLTQRGYVVLDIDYRGSAGYGRDWRTAIYRQMGTPEVEDLVDAIDYLASQHHVDRGRVGIYGGSYGGFLTFMALFTEPELFAAGAALRPVTDWAHYNHPYTSNILNTPELDPEAYSRSSPIEYAEGLQRPLLIASGMLDDNVFFQDSVRLVQRLIELQKEDWELAAYPVEPHGFREPSSWLDEYRRILKLFEEHVGPESVAPTDGSAR